MSLSQHITIAGAGLVGSLLSVMLAKRGYQVTVYEKRPDLREADIPAGRSINLALAERGMGPLNDAGLMRDVRAHLVPMRGRMLHARDGKLEFHAYGQRPEEVIYSVSRAELNKLMMTAAEQTGRVQFVFQTSCQRIDFQQQVMQVQDERAGTNREVGFEVLLGADGAGSQVRKWLVEAAGGQCTVDFLDHQYKELCIPAGEDCSYRMEKEALHIWPRGGFMLIALPNADGSYTVTLFLKDKTSPAENAESHPSFETLNDSELVVQFFQREFPDAYELIPNLTEEFAQNPTGPLGTVRCDRWCVGRVLILGDASHAIVPFHGQGMNAGFEDCSELMSCLNEAAGDWSQAIPTFADRRPPHARAIADMALENYIIMRDSVRDPRFQLKKQLGFALERQFPSRFIPRYSMVMFHRIPYAQVLQRGNVQSELLDHLTRNAACLDDIDMQRAAELVSSRLDEL